MGTLKKKEMEKNRSRKRQNKEEKKAERKANSDRGKPLEEMMAYIDENGNISSVPPKAGKIRIINAEDISLDVPSRDESPDEARQGVVTRFDSTKGYGFIKDHTSGESFFVHISNLDGPLKEADKVTFEIANGDRGPQAVSVKTIV